MPGFLVVRSAVGNQTPDNLLSFRVGKTLPCRTRMHAPTNLQLIGSEVAIVWDDGEESYVTFEKLRAGSPSAANIGETDILGNKYGGDGPKKFPGVQVVGWAIVGNYAVRFNFSDGHNTGLYSYDYLRRLAAT